MKQSQMSGDFSIESTPMGKLKWGANKMTGTGLELRDSVGNKVAQIKSGGKEGKRLEILVPWSEQLVDLVVLSGMAAKAMNKKTMEAMSEVIQAVAGG